MLKPQFRNWTFGLSQNGPMLVHPGSCEGFRSIIAYHKGRSQGIVIMTNGENGDNLMREIMNSVSKVYGWGMPGPRERVVAQLTSQQLQKLTGKYEANKNMILDIRYESEALRVYVDGDLYAVLFPETETRFFILEDRHNYLFNVNGMGDIESVTITGATPQPVTAKRIE